MNINAIKKTVLFFLCVFTFILFLQALLVVSLASPNILIPIVSIFITIVGVYDLIQVVNVNMQIKNSNRQISNKEWISTYRNKELLHNLMKWIIALYRKSLTKNILAWIAYISVYIYASYWGMMLLFFTVLFVGRDSTEEELDRCGRGLLIYFSIMFVIFIAGSIFLHRILKKRLNQKPKKEVIPE